MNQVLSPDGVKARFLLAMCFILLTLTHLVEGYVATLCGVMAFVELTSALLHYSPLYDLYHHFYSAKAKPKDL